jgi:hypothetical protein
MTDYSQRLLAVQAAIDAVLTTGQSFRYEGRWVTFADLSELRLLEKDYTAKAAAQAMRSRARVQYMVPH